MVETPEEEDLDEEAQLRMRDHLTGDDAIALQNLLEDLKSFTQRSSDYTKATTRILDLYESWKEERWQRLKEEHRHREKLSFVAPPQEPAPECTLFPPVAKVMRCSEQM